MMCLIARGKWPGKRRTLIQDSTKLPLWSGGWRYVLCIMGISTRESVLGLAQPASSANHPGHRTLKLDMGDWIIKYLFTGYLLCARYNLKGFTWSNPYNPHKNHIQVKKLRHTEKLGSSSIFCSCLLKSDYMEVEKECLRNNRQCPESLWCVQGIERRPVWHEQCAPRKNHLR